MGRPRHGPTIPSTWPIPRYEPVVTLDDCTRALRCHPGNLLAPSAVVTQAFNSLKWCYLLDQGAPPVDLS